MLWLQASHLFTCASDPVETSYKRFAFPAADDDATPAGGCAHRSRELWDEWRGIALQGGLEALLKENGSGNEPSRRARDAIAEIEIEALSAAAAVAAGGEAPSGPAALEAAVVRELGLLRAKASSFMM